MARALVVTHSPTEGPGTLAEWLPAAGLELVVVEPVGRRASCRPTCPATTR